MLLLLSINVHIFGGVDSRQSEFDELSVGQGVAGVRQEVHALLARREHSNWNTVIQV